MGDVSALYDRHHPRRITLTRVSCLARPRLADVEFNLLYDRGVKFGLSPESVERVLVSSPPMVAFRYKAIPAEGSPEAYTLDVLRNPREWAATGTD